ncbi:hypothetical protein, partial [Enterobacter cloacae complex sp. 4DZ3-17B2]|uniref:hypothetical protein n=1 Tax=Enterobacter cloacae complex sp. 4DZ3-17B2 TaxID=2511990 RepID=UPI001CA51045
MKEKFALLLIGKNPILSQSLKNYMEMLLVLLQRLGVDDDMIGEQKGEELGLTMSLSTNSCTCLMISS